MKVGELIKELSTYNPENEVQLLLDESEEKIITLQKYVIGRTKLANSLAKYTVEELQDFLHKTAFTDEDKIELVIFERILKRINKAARACEILTKEGD